MAFANELGSVPIQGDVVTTTGSNPAFAASLVADASGEKVAFIGYVWHPTVKTGTINIRKVHFRCGAVTLNVASVFQVSLQDVSATAGPPYQPDAGADQTATMTLSANAWNTTGNLSADRAVDLSVYGPAAANSRLLAVVFEETTFTAADSVIISALTTAGNALPFAMVGANGVLQTGGTWAVVAGTIADVAFECDDGTFAFLEGAVPASAIGSATTASNGTFRAIGVKFRVPTTRKIDRAAFHISILNGCDGDFVLYDSDGTTALRTIPFDNDAIYSASSRYVNCVFEPVTLLANTYYRWVFVPSTTTAATVNHLDVSAAGMMDGLYLGQDAHYTTRDSGGAWADTTTRRPHFGFGFSAFDNAAGGGGGGGMRLAGAGGLAGRG